MGKAAVLLVAAFGLTGAFYLLGTQRGMAETERELGEHQYRVIARNAALAGYQKARQFLSEDFNGATGFDGAYEDGLFGVTITRLGSVARLTSVGSVADQSGHDTYRVVAEIERELVHTIAEEPPTFMQYAMITERNLKLNGDILTDLYVQGDEASTLNANVHTNGDLSVKGNSVRVHGFGTYVGAAASDPPGALERSFAPYYNPTNAPTVAQSSRIDIPPYDTTAFMNRVNVDRSDPGDVILTGNYDLGGTREDPFIWHVQGKLTVTGATLSGYVLFMVDGNVSFGGDMKAGDSGYEGADESNIAVYAGGSIDMSGSASIYGQLFAGGDISVLHGTPSIYGTLTTRGTLDLRGTPNIYYRQASPALTIVFQDPETHYRLASYSEW